MAYTVEFLAEVALADIAYRVTADSVEELFAGAAHALTGVMVDSAAVNADRAIEINLSEDTLDDLLHEWLSHIVYLKDAQSFLLKTPVLKLIRDHPLRLQGRVLGDTIDPVRHSFGQDVKAVTYHMFEVGEEDGGYFAQVVLDI